MAKALIPFVYEERLTLPLFGGAFAREGRAQPQLSLGEFLLRRRRLSILLADGGDNAQREGLAAVIAQQEAVYREWGLHYQRKLRAELDWRARLMITALRERREEGGQLSGFGAEARRRSLAQELLLEMRRCGFSEDEQHSRRKLAEIDGELRSRTLPAPFCWDALLQVCYPREEFWWLYALAR